MRVGYGLFPPKIADYLLRIKIPYNVNVAALVAVEESLKDADYLMGRVKAIIACSGSFYSYFVLGRKRNILIAIGILLSLIAEHLLWHIGLPAWTLDTVSETLVGVGFLLAMEPLLRKVDEKWASQRSHYRLTPALRFAALPKLLRNFF